MRISTKTFNEYPKYKYELLGLLRMFGDVELDYGMALIYQIRTNPPIRIMTECHESNTILSQFDERLVGIISYNYLPKLPDVLSFFKDHSYSLSCYLYVTMRLFYHRYTHLSIADVKIPFVHENVCAPQWLNELIEQLHKEHVLKGHKPEDSFFNVKFARPRDSIAESISGVQMEQHFDFDGTHYQKIAAIFGKTEAALFACRFSAGFITSISPTIDVRINHKTVRGIIYYERDYTTVSKNKRRWVITLRDIKV